GLQSMLQAEAEEPLLLYGLLGERGASDGLMAAIQSGEIKMAQLRGLLGGVARTGFSQEDLQLLLLFTSVRSQRTGLLRYLTEMVEVAKLPMEQQAEKIKKSEAKIHQLPIMARLLAPATSKAAAACHRTGAEFRCAVVAMAVERYRLAHGHWPESLSELLPEYLRSIPKDPFDGAELRYLDFDEGVVIYSVGPDGVDNGGNITQNPSA